MSNSDADSFTYIFYNDMNVPTADVLLCICLLLTVKPPYTVPLGEGKIARYTEGHGK